MSYGFIQDAQSTQLEGLRLCWEEDVGGNIEVGRWRELVASWHTCSREAQSQLILYKFINRSYWTPCKLAKLKLRNSDTCWKCEKEGTLVHLLYFCEKNKNLWEEIISLLNKLFQFRLNLQLCVFWVCYRDNIVLNKQKLGVRLATTTACRIILRHWTLCSPCGFWQEWPLLNRLLTEWKAEKIFFWCGLTKLCGHLGTIGTLGTFIFIFTFCFCLL